jgi:hypothetical protein
MLSLQSEERISFITRPETLCVTCLFFCYGCSLGGTFRYPRNQWICGVKFSCCSNVNFFVPGNSLCQM